MIKDRGQKKLAARFCAVQGVVPFAEVLVRSAASIDDVPIDMTDVDIMGIDVTRMEYRARTIFDCKTANKQSGINRALWASGLKSYVNASSAFIIQIKKVPATHRVVAASMGIHIHTEDSFRRYAASISQDFLRDVTYLDEMDRWDDLITLSKQYPGLSDLVFFVTTQAAIETSGPRALRNGLSIVMKSAGELDPAKAAHRMLFQCALSAFLLHASYAVADLKNVFDFNMSQLDFDRLLRFFLWEGRENYELRRKLRRALIERTSASDAEADFDLPEWPRLLQLFRTFLEAPEGLASLPLIAKELAFREAMPSSKADADQRLVSLFSSNKRARQFIFAASSYLCAASGVPRDFERLLEEQINKLLS